MIAVECRVKIRSHVLASNIPLPLCVSYSPVQWKRWLKPAVNALWCRPEFHTRFHQGRGRRVLSARELAWAPATGQRGTGGVFWLLVLVFGCKL